MKIRTDVAEWAYVSVTYPTTTYHLVSEDRAACRRNLTLTDKHRTAKQVDANAYGRFCVRCWDKAAAAYAAEMEAEQHAAESDQLAAMTGHELRAAYLDADEAGDERRAGAVIREQIRRWQASRTAEADRHDVQPSEATGRQSVDLTGARCHTTDPHERHRIIGSWRGSCAGIPDAPQGPRRWINHYDADGRWCRWSLCAVPRGSAADRRCPAECPTSATEPTPPTLCTARVDDSPSPCGAPAPVGELWCRRHLDADDATAEQ